MFQVINEVNSTIVLLSDQPGQAAA